MSDADLRELERRFRETGGVEDEGSWLRARVQAGELREERLKLAAALGHRAAHAVSGEPAADPFEWTNGLCRRQDPLMTKIALRAAIAAARHAAEAVPMEGVWLTSLSAAEEAASAPSSASSLRAEEAGESAFEVCSQLNSEADAVRGAGLAHACAGLSVNGNYRAVERAVTCAFHVERATGVSMPTATSRVRSALAAELVPWALGYSDPVRDRVEARQRAEAARE